MSLAGRVALITGGSRGIGRAIAIALAEDGADIAINYRRDAAAAAETLAAVTALGRRAAVYRASVAEPAESREMVEAVLRDFGYVDILINNAGFAPRLAAVADADAAEFAAAMATHAFGPFLLCKLVLSSMRGRPRGDVVFVSSSTAMNMPAGMATYCMSKAAQEALAMTLAREEARHGIHVNVVAPGLTETDLGIKAMRARGVTDLRSVDASQPFGHVCQPSEVAAVVRYLVSHRASALTGQKFAVHGGSNLGS